MARRRSPTASGGDEAGRAARRPLGAGNSPAHRPSQLPRAQPCSLGVGRGPGPGPVGRGRPQSSPTARLAGRESLPHGSTVQHRSRLLCPLLPGQTWLPRASSPRPTSSAPLRRGRGDEARGAAMPLSLPLGPALGAGWIQTTRLQGLGEPVAFTPRGSWGTRQDAGLGAGGQKQSGAWPLPPRRPEPSGRGKSRTDAPLDARARPSAGTAPPRLRGARRVPGRPGGGRHKAPPHLCALAEPQPRA